MDRRNYWNGEYTKYWKMVTNDAEDKNGETSSVKKLSGNDFKAPDRKVITELFDVINYNKSDKVLDYGCGFGRFFPYFSDKCDYYGIDISKSMIDECIRLFPKEEERFIVAEGENLPFSSGFFDKIICNGVFDACYQEDALYEMFRVCGVDGIILFSGKNDNYFNDDEEAYIAEENARKKGHPNFFTNVNSMLNQLHDCCDIIEQRYALRRGDLSKGTYTHEIPERFYEWILIIKKREMPKHGFERFSDMYSKTWKVKNNL